MQTGGELYDKGGYGCIFIPSLICKGENETPKHVISKIAMTADAQEEFAIATKIRNLPFWKNFYVVPESMCIPANRDIQKDEGLDSCELLDLGNDTRSSLSLSAFRILRMKFGGTPLSQHRFNFYRDSFTDFSIHLIAAVANLTLHGIVHRDIHQGNILVDDVSIPRLIDFNLSVDVTRKLTPSMLRHGYTIAIYQEPPDSTLVNAIANGADNPNAIIELILKEKKGLSKIQTVLGIDADTMQTEFTEFYSRSKSMQSGDEVAWFKYFWRVIDSWAVGINLVYLLFNHLLWPSFVKSNDYMLYKKDFIPVIRDMCQVNPHRRIDCVQALARVAPDHFLLRTVDAKKWLSLVASFSSPHHA